MNAFIIYSIEHGRVMGFELAANKRAALKSLRAKNPSRCYGGKFGLQVELVSEWTESEFDQAGGWAMPRNPQVNDQIVAAFGI